MMDWFHASWSQVLDDDGQVPLCVYAQWFESSLDEASRYLAERGEAISPSQTNGARTSLRANSSTKPRTKAAKDLALQERTASWRRWLKRNALVDDRCALITRIQLGVAADMLANGFDIPAPLLQVPLILTSLQNRKGSGAPRDVQTRSGFFAVIDEQLMAWWRDPSYTPALPCVPATSDFQQRAQGCIGAIAAGKTATYKQIAQRMGSAPRAVGQACRNNHLPLIVPCHRIVGSHSQGGYLGHGADANISADALKYHLLLRETSGE